jgi:hypothetical protein
VEELRRKERERLARQPAQCCGVDGCEYQTKYTSHLKEHQTRVHGIGDVEAADKRRRKQREYSARRQPAQRRGVEGGESEESESEISESEESGAPVELELAEKEPAEEEPDMPAVGSTVVVKWGSKLLPSEVVQANAWEVPDNAPKNSTRTVLGFVVSWEGIGEDSESFVPMTGGLSWRASPPAGAPAARGPPPPAVTPVEPRPPSPPGPRAPPPPPTWHACDTPGCAFRASTRAELAEHTESEHDYMDI